MVSQLVIRDFSVTIIASVTLVFAFSLFFNVGTAHAQLCDGSGLSGNITVVGPKGCSVPQNPCGVKGGTAGCPCKVSGTLGGSVKAICSATRPCCERVSQTSAQDAAQQSSMGGFDPSQLMQMLQQMMQGGGGGGGGGGSPSDFTDPTEQPGLLDNNPADPSFLDTALNNLTDVIFGEGSDTAITPGDGTATQDGTLTDGPTGAPGQEEPAQEGDTVVTTYEYLEAVADGDLTDAESATFSEANDDFSDDFDDDFDRDLAGGSDFEDDFFGADLDDGSATSTFGLSREALEIQGLEELARRGADAETHSGSLQLPYESLTPAEIRSLQDYHSSAVAVSGKLSPFQGNPLSNERYDAAGEPLPIETEEPGFFKKVFSLFASIFGFGTPSTQ